MLLELVLILIGSLRGRQCQSRLQTSPGQRPGLHRRDDAKGTGADRGAGGGGGRGGGGAHRRGGGGEAEGRGQGQEEEVRRERNWWRIARARFASVRIV